MEMLAQTVGTNGDLL